MRNRIVLLLTLSVILFATLAVRCAATRHLWFRIKCAVDQNGGAPNVPVAFHVVKVDQSGKPDLNSILDDTEVTQSDGWTPAFKCDYDMAYDNRSTEFLEDVRTIATVNYEGTKYSDTVKYTPVAFLSDTQSITLEVYLPSVGAQGNVASPSVGVAGK